MLYDSTKSLLQSILCSLETGEIRWDEQTESGNACLYEMHQMSAPLYKAYRSDSLSANSMAQSSLPEKLHRAMPHARRMVIAIRHKDQPRALESGKAALAEMNGIGPSISSYTEPKMESKEASITVRQQANPIRKHRRVVEGRRTSTQIRASGGK